MAGSLVRLERGNGRGRNEPGEHLSNHQLSLAICQQRLLRDQDRRDAFKSQIIKRHMSSN